MDATEFAARHGITVVRVASTDTDRRWIVELHRSGVPDFVGLIEWPHAHPPDLPAILTGLASAATAVAVSVDPLEWARHAGVEANDDLRTKFGAALLQARHLEHFLPVGAYETLCWGVSQR